MPTHSSTAANAPAVSTIFAQDVLSGLKQTAKTLPAKYFYDEHGDRLFQDIMHMPAYYLTGCELEIFQQQQAAILKAIGSPSFHLLELGAGDGYKTQVLLRHFLEAGAAFDYQPVDISENVLIELEQRLREELPGLKVTPLAGDYFKVLHEGRQSGQGSKVVLFLGANIGNYPATEAGRFLRQLYHELNPGDKLLIGFDLKKDPATILKAYNDPEGITAAFNLNLLKRINRELHANFNLQEFRHWETYDPQSGEARSYLVSQKPQHVFIRSLNRSFFFDAWEAIQVELSKKYSLHEVEALAAATGFQVQEHFTDSRDFFVDSLWVKA